MKKRLGFDIGHGKNTYPPSKGVPGFAEWEFNNAVAKIAKPLAEYNGFEVLLTQPFDNEDVSLRNRVDYINAEHGKKPIDLLMSIHADFNNNSSAEGHWNFYWHTSNNSKRLAEIWNNWATELMPNPSRGIRESKVGEWTNFMILRETLMPAGLMEHAFYSNADDLELLKSDTFREICAEALVRTACEYCGIEFKQLPKEETTDNSITIKLENGEVVKGYKIDNDILIPLSSIEHILKPINVIDYDDIRDDEDNEVEEKEVEIVTLRRGMKGQLVKEYQEKLIRLGYSLGSWGADGDFGATTERVTKQFQQDNKLVADGIAGRNTFNKIEDLLKNQTSKNNSYTFKGATIIEIDPKDLYIDVVKQAGNQVKGDFINGSLYSHKLMQSISTLVSKGKVLAEHLPHDNVKRGTLVVYNDGTVKVEMIDFVSKFAKLKDIWFAIGGFNIMPQDKTVRQQLVSEWFSWNVVGYKTWRSMLGYHPTKKKVLVVIAPNTDAEQGNKLLKDLGCECGISLDSGGSTCGRFNGKTVRTVSRVIHNVVRW